VEQAKGRTAVDLDELEAQARERLTPAAYDYYAGGAGTEATLRDNGEAWGRWRLRPYVLRDVSRVELGIQLLGAELATPIVVAPTAYHRLAHDGGEAATARGAAEAGALMVVSTLATTSLEDVAAAAPEAPRWFQLYVFDDRGYAGELVDRAVAAGYRALVLTVDAPVLGYRPRDERNAFRLPEGIAMANLPLTMPDTHGSGLAALFGSIDRTLTIDDLAWLAERSGLPVILKGVHRGDDAARCVDAGVAAVIVSNHGGRQLDGAIATADALPEVVEAVAGRAPVLVDGGLRHGADVLKALALGASAVLVGRPILWGLTTGGAAGVRDVLGWLRTDLERAMVLAGVTDVAAVPRDLVCGWPPAR
jgi:4-hydroxymandelate oxidase